MFCSKCGKELPEGSEFCSKCGRALNTTATAKKKSHVGSTVLGIALCALLLIGLISYLSHKTLSSLSPSPAPAPVLVPGSTNLFTGQIIVRAGGYVKSTFTVEPGMQNFHVAGHFTASGGVGNDIQVVLAEESEFQNWINGHQAKVFYSTDKETTGHFDVGPLAPGQYVFAFSNTFSLLTEKQVFAQVDANWLTRR
jgi:predicted nucleic acid-binding Zn ribbon protein